jgi:hypothetical protein
MKDQASEVTAALDAMPADWMLNDDYGSVRGWLRSQGIAASVDSEVHHQQQAAHEQIKREQRELAPLHRLHQDRQRCGVRLCSGSSGMRRRLG